MWCRGKEKTDIIMHVHSRLQNHFSLWFQVWKGSCWAPLLCIGWDKHLVHERTWPEFPQLPTGTHFCSIFVLMCLLQRAFRHCLFWERDLLWSSQVILGFLILMKNSVQDQHMVQALTLFSILHFLEKSCAAAGFKKRTIAKLLCLFLIISIHSTHRCCLLRDSLSFSLSRQNIWKFLS